jgi:hypothetical protein
VTPEAVAEVLRELGIRAAARRHAVAFEPPEGMDPQEVLAMLERRGLRARLAGCRWEGPYYRCYLQPVQ